jgi:multidrug resistance efflux pump
MESYISCVEKEALGLISAEETLEAAQKLDQHQKILDHHEVLKKEYDISYLTTSKESSEIVKAPFSGVILESFVTEGACLDETTLLYRLASVEKVWVEGAIEPSLLHQIPTGAKVWLAHAGSSCAQWEGLVERVGSFVDDRGKVLVHISVKDPSFPKIIHAPIRILYRR